MNKRKSTNWMVHSVEHSKALTKSYVLYIDMPIAFREVEKKSQ